MSDYARSMDRFGDWRGPAKAMLAVCVGGAVAVVWSVLASLVFLVGTRMMTASTLPLVQWWTYYFAYGWSHPAVGLWLKLSAVVATVVPLAMVAGRLARHGGLGVGRTRALHGKTRWATRGELKRENFYATFGGLYLGKDSKGRYLRFGGEEHVACYAPTRSGKGVGLVIPNCMLYDASLICLDVKRENWEKTAGIRARARQKVFLFDPLAEDGRTARYNPFHYVRRGTVDGVDDIQRIAQFLFPHVTGDQQFWSDSARAVFVGCASYLAETPELDLTIGAVLRVLADPGEVRLMMDRMEARRKAGKPYLETTVNALKDFHNGSPELVNSIRKTVTARLSLWYNPRVDAATSGNDFDLRTLRHALHAIYVGVTPDNIPRLRPLLQLFFQQLVDLSVRSLPANDKTAKHQILMLLDEFPLLGPMPMLADAFAYIAGYGIRMMLIMQSKAQLRDKAAYGPDKAEAILENCGVEVVFRVKDLNLSKEISDRIGYDTVEGSSRTGPRFYAVFQRHRLSQTRSDQRRAWMLPQEVAKMDAMDALLIRAGMNVGRCRRIEYYKERLFAPLELAPPQVSPIQVKMRLDMGGISEAERKRLEAGPVAGTREAAAAVPGSEGSAGPVPGTLLVSAEGEDRLVAEDDAEQELDVVAVGGSGAARTGATEAKGQKPRRRDKGRGDGRGGGNVIEGRWGKQVGGGDDRQTELAFADPEDEMFPALEAHQADQLLQTIGGVELELSGLGLEDSKQLIAALVGTVPTVWGGTEMRPQSDEGTDGEAEASGGSSNLGRVTARGEPGVEQRY